MNKLSILLNHFFNGLLDYFSEAAERVGTI